MEPQPDHRLAIDVGGTFTDTVLMDAEGRIAASAKTLTTHGDPSQGALEGAERALAALGIGAARIGGFVHGTTLATNALLEKRGARVATVTTEGFRDILEIAYERRYSQYDIDLEKPDFLVPRTRSFTVPERMSVDGRVLRPLDETTIDGLLSAIDAQDVEALAICLLHAYANPDHERRLRDRIAVARPDLAISLGSEVSPEAREFDRLSTTVANAYVQPTMAGYLARFREAFAARGFACPILMMTAGGGMTTLETAARFPIRLVESGPAGGAILAARVAREAGLDAVVSFDMGGTTAKLCLIDAGQPQTARNFEIGRAARFVKGSGMPVRIPVIEMIEIGAGGGSIAAVDRLGRLTVGPRSAGSEPGPVAFGRGGSEPTVTDADVALGYIDPGSFAEGRLSVDAEAAARALEATVGAALGLDATGAAEGVSGIVDEAMASAGRAHAVESGKDLSQRTMIAFGGNGPLHACRVARAAGVGRVLVPPAPGVGSAVGFLHAPVSYEIVRSRYGLFGSLDLDGVAALLEEMSEEARAVVRQGAPDGALTVSRTAFLRYRGQGHEIEVALPDRPLAEADLPAIVHAFERAYSAQFSRPVPGMGVEVLNWAVRVSTPDAEAQAPPPPAPVPCVAKTRGLRCDVTGADVTAALVRRDALAPGDALDGPALIVEPQTTTFVAADFSAAVDAAGHLILTRRAMA
ncbi:MAG: hydantoinase/oxoprolinase family protein [Pseudomonadota bacterium]